jgi:hypothetical protein
MHESCKISAAISEMTLVLGGVLEQLKDNKHNAILRRMAELEEKVMSAISDYSTVVDATFTAIGTSVDEIVASQAGITLDVAGLKEIILRLQNNPGPISPEDQALLDSGVAKVTALAGRVAAVSSALKELDAATEAPPRGAASLTPSINHKAATVHSEAAFSQAMTSWPAA